MQVGRLYLFSIEGFQVWDFSCKIRLKIEIFLKTHRLEHEQEFSATEGFGEEVAEIEVRRSGYDKFYLVMIDQVLDDFGDFGEILDFVDEDKKPFVRVSGLKPESLINDFVIGFFESHQVERVIEIKPQFGVVKLIEDLPHQGCFSHLSHAGNDQCIFMLQVVDDIIIQQAFLHYVNIILQIYAKM
jgi:hypothetical protein